MTKLYVGNLDPMVTQQRLLQKFSTVGQVVNITLRQDSPNSAYVTFEKQSDAERALKSMNGDILYERSIVIKWPEELSDSDISIDSKNNLPLTARTSRQSRHGNFHINQRTDNPSSTGKRSRSVMPTGRNQHPNTYSAPEHSNLFIKNFGDLFNDDSLYGLFRKYGRIYSCKVAKDEFGRSRGFGFCNFRDVASAEKAIEGLNGQVFDGMRLYVGFFMTQDEREEEKIEQSKRRNNLYIKDLDQSIDNKELFEAFRKFGYITSVKVEKDIRGKSKGFGFVCYNTEESAAEAIAEMDGSYLGRRRIYVDYAQSKDERQTFLMQQRSRSIDPLRTRLPVTGLDLRSTIRINQPDSVIPNNPSSSSEQFSFVENRFDKGRDYSVSTSPKSASKQSEPVHNYFNPMPSFPTQPKSNAQPRKASIQGPLTQAALHKRTTQERKQVLRECLFPIVQRMEPGLAEQITGMLLENDISEILSTLRDPDAFKAKVQQAVATLQPH